MYVIETKSLDYVEKYDSVETPEENENICIEYKKLLTRQKDSNFKNRCRVKSICLKIIKEKFENLIIKGYIRQ